MKKLTETTVNISAIVPAKLHGRLVRQAGKETIDSGQRITPSKVVRSALEDYLDQWENATFVAARTQPTGRIKIIGRTSLSAKMPAELHGRLVRQAAKATIDGGRTITPSKLLRWAIEDYLDQWETATCVADPA